MDCIASRKDSCGDLIAEARLSAGFRSYKKYLVMNRLIYHIIFINSFPNRSSLFRGGDLGPFGGLL